MLILGLENAVPGLLKPAPYRYNKNTMKIELSEKFKLFKPFLFEELYRKERSERAKGKDIISLAVGDPDIPTAKGIVASTCAARSPPGIKEGMAWISTRTTRSPF